MSFLVFFLALSIMIFLHELGHFLIAKLNGLRVEEFGFGYPPRIIGKKIKGTIYSLNWIPMGGFVRIWGMDEEVKADKEKAFYSQPGKTQLGVLSAGVLMNFLSAILVFALVYGIQGVPQKLDQIKIIDVLENSPAAEAGLEKDTFIDGIEISGVIVQVENNKEFVQLVNENAEKEIVLVTGSNDRFSVVPRENPPEGEGALGIVIADSELVKLPFWKRIPLGIWYGLREALFWGWEMIKGFGLMVKGIFKGEPPTDVAGPIGIYKVSSSILMTNGLLATIHFFAIISINLAIVNLLPLPGTDGWHVGILGLEKIRGRALKEKTKSKINQWAMIFILVLSLLIIISDIKRFLL